ncbi:carotenoid biosynthesis protein [Nocardia macrotermitis]|nr:carotenoid biosynthesis protein [Nocardia macrotermitis]
MPAVAAVLLVLTQITYPLATGVARDRVTAAVVLLSALTAVTHAWATRGPRWAAGLLLIVSGLGLVAEICGVTTGFPFGCYDYARHRLGPELAGVPLLVPLAWTGGLYPVWVVAGLLSPPGTPRARTRIPLTALGAVGWDLFLDPQMVSAGQWTWCSPLPGLPGTPQIPYTNYLGWFAVALLMAALLELLDRADVPADRGPAVPVAVFLWTWLGSTLAHAVFLGLPASAGYGFLGLGLLGVPLLYTSARRMPVRSAGHGTM